LLRGVTEPIAALRHLALTDERPNSDPCALRCTDESPEFRVEAKDERRPRRTGRALDDVTSDVRHTIGRIANRR